MAPEWVPFYLPNISNSNMILDRTIAPEQKSFHTIAIPKLDIVTLANGCPLHIINTATQPVVRFEIYFNAGNKFEIKTGQSFFTTKMLGEGTSKYGSTSIAEKFAVIGYFFELSQGAERSVITLNGLTKHLRKALEIVCELIADSIFPEKEIENLKTISKQQLAVNLEKTSYLASKAFKETVFGPNHYAGKSMSKTDIENIEQSDLMSFYANFFKNKAFKLFVSGQITYKEIEIIESLFGGFLVEETPQIDESKIDFNYYGKQIIIEKEGTLQSSIRIGSHSIDRHHSDYFPLKVCNTIFGGYFGSRLMKNIREDKGYTYGISSSHLPIPKHGYLLIGTDVKREFTQKTIDEIYKEIEILQKELVGDEELEVVKNFIIGDFAGSLNTPFDIAEKHKMIIYEGLGLDFFDKFVNEISKITSLNVQEMANKYFLKDKMIEIVVGGK